jgi:hypothetical protein
MELHELLAPGQEPPIHAEHLDVAVVPLAALVAGDSPRLSGENAAHVRRLAESEEPLPPLLVHRQTMQVVDGMHRLRAAELRRDAEIEVRYVDGDAARIFVLSVQANITHGLPLTLADRKAAASRIIELYPEWSDRMIAAVAGIAAKTAAGVRRRLTGEKLQLDVRIGRDGRTRPVNSAARREIAAQLMSDNPHYSLREVARAAGVSPETARSVRARLQSPFPAQQPGGRTGQASTTAEAAIRALRADPACRSSESGRLLLRMLSLSLELGGCGDQLVEDTPAHCLGWVGTAAQACAQVWGTFAELVERRTEGSEPCGTEEAQPLGVRDEDDSKQPGG